MNDELKTKSDITPENNDQPKIEGHKDPSPSKKDSGVGPVIGSIIIIILIVICGLYFLGYVMKKNGTESPLNNEQNLQEVNSEEIQDPEITEINNELNSTEFDEIDRELEQIDAEIDAELESQ